MSLEHASHDDGNSNDHSGSNDQEYDRSQGEDVQQQLSSLTVDASPPPTSSSSSSTTTAANENSSRLEHNEPTTTTTTTTSTPKDDATIKPMMTSSTPTTPYTRSYSKSLSTPSQPHHPRSSSSRAHHNSNNSSASNSNNTHPTPHAQNVRRLKTSMSAFTSIDPSGRLVQHLLGGNQVSHDPSSKVDASPISVHVRYVSRDLWVRIDIPRNIPVNKARDLILRRCQLSIAAPTTATKSEPLTLTGVAAAAATAATTSTFVDGDRTPTSSINRRSDDQGDKTPTGRAFQSFRNDGSSAAGSGSSTKGSAPNLSDLQVAPTDKPKSRSLRSMTKDKDKRKDGDLHHRTLKQSLGLHSVESIESEEDGIHKQVNADALLARYDLFTDSINGPGELASINYMRPEGFPLALPPQQHNHHDEAEASSSSFASFAGAAQQKTQQQLKRLLSNSTMQSNSHQQQQQQLDSNSLQFGTPFVGSLPPLSLTPPERGALGTNLVSPTSSTASRIGSHIPGWNAWRERHNSQSGNKYAMERDGPFVISMDNAEMMAACYGVDEGEDGRGGAVISGSATAIGGDDGGAAQGSPVSSGRIDCEAWRSSFGLFWVANGHWLDDSRLLSSYNLQPQDLLELQLRNHYIQLPPPVGQLSYYDHYAEGVLYKLSKKSRPSSLLTGYHQSQQLSAKESSVLLTAGVWKERWVVLQGTKLLIYHKRKDSNKKTIDLPTPLNVHSRMLVVDSATGKHGNGYHSNAGFAVQQAPVSGRGSHSFMSNTMIALTGDDPSSPRIFLRGTSEHDILHWVRIFESLNSTAAPLTSSLFGHGPSTNNHRHASSVSSSSIDGSNGANSSHQYGSSTTVKFPGSYSSERKRNHTAHNLGASHFQPSHVGGNEGSTTESASATMMSMTVPSINPVTISNAAAVLSSFSSHNNYLQSNNSNNITTNATSAASIASINKLAHAGNGHYNHGHPLNALNNHLRNICQATPMTPSLSASSTGTVTHRSAGAGGSSATGGVEPVGLSGGLLSLTSDSSSKPGAEESRRRAITEPNRFWLSNAQQMALQQKTKGHAKQASKVSAPDLLESGLVRPLDLSNVSEAPFKLDSPPATNAAMAAAAAAAITSPGASSAVTTSTGTSKSSMTRRPVLGTEYLDNASERLLATSSARSSVAPVYIGYIWLFVPSEGLVLEDGFTLPTDNETVASADDECDNGRTKQETKSKAPGRFVKCFATINDQGHFQWVEVKKQNEIESEQDAAPSPTFNPRMGSAFMGYSRGASLTGGMLPPMPASPTSSVASSHGGPSSSSRPTYGVQLRPATKTSSGWSVSPIATDSDGGHPLQILVARTKRMFCFCIKIKPSALSDVLLNMEQANGQRVKSATVASDSTSTTATVGPTSIHHQQQSSQQQLNRSNIGNGGNVGDSKAQRHSGGHSIENTMPLSSSVTDRTMSSPPQLPPISTVSMSLSLSTSSLGSVNEGAGGERGADSRRPLLVSHKGSSHSLKSMTPPGASESLHHSFKEEEPSSSFHIAPPLPTRMTLSEVMEAKKGLIPDSAATMDQFKQRVQEKQEQIHQQQQSRYPQPSLRTQNQNHNQRSLDDSAGPLSPSGKSSPVSMEESKPPAYTCPFLEVNHQDFTQHSCQEDQADKEGDEYYVTLKGYTETEEGWRILQNAFERFLVDNPIQKNISALPPDDTLIPSYHSLGPLAAEPHLSEKAQQYLEAKQSLIDEAHLAAAVAAVDAARAPTPDLLGGAPAGPISGGAGNAGDTSGTGSMGAVAQIRAVSLNRWKNLSGSGDREKSKSKEKSNAVHRHSPSGSSLSLQTPVPAQYSGNILSSTAPSTPVVQSGFDSRDEQVQDFSFSSLTSPSTPTALEFYQHGSGGSNLKWGTSSASNPMSLSVGSGSNLFRPRTRLNPQRSADELSKASTQTHHTAIPTSSTAPSITISGGGMGNGASTGGLYSTATAMMHPLSPASPVQHQQLPLPLPQIQIHPQGLSSQQQQQQNKIRSLLQGSLSRSFSDEDSYMVANAQAAAAAVAAYNLAASSTPSPTTPTSATSPKTPKSAKSPLTGSSSVFMSMKPSSSSSSSARPPTSSSSIKSSSSNSSSSLAASLSKSHSGPRSMSLTAATNGEKVRTMVMSTTSHLDQQQQQQYPLLQREQDLMTPPPPSKKDRPTRNSLSSLQSLAHLTALKGLGGGSQSQSSNHGSTAVNGNNGGHSFFSQEHDQSLSSEEHRHSLQGPRRSSEGVLSSTGVAGNGGSSGLLVNGGKVGMLSANGSSSGIGPSSKKHQTVLGAGKAAVSGVFGKFRKSVG
ncbi:hypothetical protein EMPS_00050 [Entomortierella parvispora]|uniref:PH domain-containing protein n=1 Tax=Entomortierella parvispora TaxID=205924 RepID=A0A9P3LQS9_9FUNG|nr:hypothetical protein EMPS_00050 [Entomortierella parvispora]